MTAGKSNLPASVAARLLTQAKQKGDVYETLLTSFCFERFLYRLGKSEARERFVLKGAMLLRLLQAMGRRIQEAGRPAARRTHLRRVSESRAGSLRDWG